MSKGAAYLQLLEKLLQGVLRRLTNHNLHNLLADELLLGSLCVAGSLDLALVSASECNAEHAQQIAVAGLGLNKGLNQGVPLLNKSAKLVAGGVHAIEVSVAVHALNFLDLELDLSPGGFVVLILQVSE
jgi:hypothetical protein